MTQKVEAKAKCQCGCECCTAAKPPLVGQKAPDFKLEGYFKGAKKQFSLEDKNYKGKWVVLFFYPLDFTFVCPTELQELSQRQAEFKTLNAEILGISIDSVYSHEAWLKELGDFNYPLLSDLTKQVSRDYGVLLEEAGISLRGAFLINPAGVVKASLINDLEVGRNVDELLRLITAFKTGHLCPVGWQKGQKTLGKA